VPLNLDHVAPKSLGGSNRASNLTLACIPCNQAKGSQPVEEFLANDPKRLARVKTQLRTPLRDAAAVNATRWAVKARLEALGLPVACWSGGRTKWNRHRLFVAKSHVADAAVCGDVQGVRNVGVVYLVAAATGRGSHQRTRTDAYGFFRLALPRTKRIHGFATGDLV
ncbi:HNH endonuclease, partial [mine drainage metagenome]